MSWDKDVEKKWSEHFGGYGNWLKDNGFPELTTAAKEGMLRDLTYQVYRAEAEGMERAQRVLDKMTSEQLREVAGKIEERERAKANEA